MTINLSAVTNNQTFGTWLQRTNDLVTALSSNIVTVDSSLGGSVSTGNGFVNGIFGSNTFYATYISGGNLTSNSLLTITTNTQVNATMYVGNTSTNVAIGWLPGDLSIMEMFANQNNFAQAILTNSNNGTTSSGDFVIADNGGLTSTNYIDMGINGSNWSNSSWTINGGSDGYLYTGNTNLSIGTAGQKYINFFANGTLATNEVMRITSGANVGIGNTNPNAKLQVTGTANISANVSIGGVANLYSDINVSGNASITGNTYIVGTANIVGNVYLSNSITVANSLVVPTISGNTFIGGVVNVVSNNVNVSVNTYFGNNLTVAGIASITGNTSIANSIAVTGNATFSNSLLVTGGATFNNTVTIANNLTVPVISGNSFIGGVINVVSNNVNVSVNTYFGNNVTIIGNLNVSGNLVYTGSSAGNIIPVNNSYSLGNSTQTWALFSSNVNISNGSFVSIGNTSYTTSGIYNFGSSANATIDQFAAATYRSAEYLIQASNSTAYQLSKVLVLHDGTTAYSTEYAIVNSAATAMLTLGVTKSGANVLLWSTPVDSTVVVKYTRSTLVV